MDAIETLVTIALDLTAALEAEDRYRRLLKALKRAIPYDAAALMRLEGSVLVPISTQGMTEDIVGRPFALAQHPRLEIISKSEAPVLFPADTSLPDPFEPYVMKCGTLEGIHSCFGCPLYIEGRLIGALTADACDPRAFDHLDRAFLKAVGAIAGAQVHTAELLDALEGRAHKQGLIAQDLMRDTQMRHGTRIVGRSGAVTHLLKEIELVAHSDFSVLILGETGVGKELVARALHAASTRSNRPLFYVNCAALPETLADSELFGHVKGAFTGANQDREGKFEVADGATLFLDEIGELPIAIQPKLLRAIQEGEIQRVGANKTVKVDVRLLAATNRDLKAEMEAGRFRADLFHRLNVYPLTVPPLRERLEDIVWLTEHFARRIRRRMGLGEVAIAPEVQELLAQYHWPGNVRELENVISRAILTASARVLRGNPVQVTPAALKGEFHPAPNQARKTSHMDSPPAKLSLRQAVDAFQRQLIRKAVARYQGNWSAAARDLDMHRSNLYHLAKRLGLIQKKSK